MKKLLVLMTAEGQFGNRLQSAAYFLAACYEHNARAKLLCFDGYEDSLRIIRSGLLSRLSRRVWRKVMGTVSRSPVLKKLLGCEVLHGSRGNNVRLSSPEVQAIIQRSRVVVVTGYYIYCHPSVLQKHADAIRSRLAASSIAGAGLCRLDCRWH